MWYTEHHDWVTDGARVWSFHFPLCNPFCNWCPRWYPIYERTSANKVTNSWINYEAWEDLRFYLSCHIWTTSEWVHTFPSHRKPSFDKQWNHLLHLPPIEISFLRNAGCGSHTSSYLMYFKSDNIWKVGITCFHWKKSLFFHFHLCVSKKCRSMYESILFFGWNIDFMPMTLNRLRWI